MLLLLIALYCISTFSLTAIVLQYTQPFFLLGARMSIAGLVLLTYAFFNKCIHLHKKHVTLCIQTIVFAIFLPYALRLYGLQNADPSRSYLLYNLGPLITYLFTHLLDIEKITWQRSTAILVSFIGLLLLLGTPSTYYITNPQAIMPQSLPEYALILSLLSFSYGWITIKKLIIDLKYSPALINGIAMLGGGILSVGAALTIETPPYVTNIPLFITFLPMIIVTSNLIAHTLYAYLLNTYSLTLLQLGYWIIPALSTIGQIVCLQKIPSLTTLYALFLLILGFILLYQCEKIYAVKKIATHKN